MKRLALLSASLFLVLGLLGPSTAQAQVKLGPRLGFDAGDVEGAFIGADVRFGTAALPVTLNPTFDIYFPDAGSFWGLSGNALYTFGINNQVFDPYAGGGLGVYRRSIDVGTVDASSTDLGLNFLFGAEFSAGGLSPFLEAQVTPIFADGSSTLFTIKGGLLFSL